VFRPAEVEVGKDVVTLTNKQVAEPVSARYGWQPYSTGNLTNGTGLPASTFLLTLPRK
jgi:sialate O-acetylesterase